MKLTVTEERWPLAGEFRISRHAYTETRPTLVEINDAAGTLRGRGECSPTPHYNESVESVSAELNGLADAVAAGLDRAALAERLGPGAARNGLDCALWDLDAKRAGQPVWQLAGLDAPAPVITAYTIGIRDPDATGQAAAEHAARPLLKLKMAGDANDLARVQAVRANAPNADIIIDANEAWSIENYRDLVPALVKLGVAMIEQPFPAGQDEVLSLLARPIPVCADESCHTRDDVAALAGCYDMVNIKLDKTGGLTEALRLRADALAAGMQIMVGCMVGTSLAMAPALLVAQGARFVDIDGPLLLSEDRKPGLAFDGSTVSPAEPALWG